MRRPSEYPYPNSKIVMAVFWTAMAFGAFWVFAILALFALTLVFLPSYDDSSSRVGPVTEAERRFCDAVARGFGYDREAVAQYTRAIALSADDERVPRPKLGAGAGDSPYGEGWLYAAALNNRGVEYVAFGEPDKALADFSEALRVDPSMEMVYRNRALVHMRNGDYAAAVDDFDSAVAYSRYQGFSYNEGAYLGRAVAHKLAGDADKAAADFRLARYAGHYLADDQERAAEHTLSALGSVTYGGARGNLCPDNY